MRRRQNRAGVVLVGWLLLAAGAAHAGGTYTVDRFDDEVTADGCADATPEDCSLRGAVRKANQDGVDSVILLPDGLYRLTVEGAEEDAAATGDLDFVSDDLTIESLPGGHPVIEQRAADRIFHAHSLLGDLTIRGPMTLLGGSAVNSSGLELGGSLYFFRADSLTMTDVDLRDGSAPDDGGCLYWATPSPSAGFLHLERVRLEDCHAGGNGGGLAIQSGPSPVTLEAVEIRRNTADDTGGGTWIFAGTAPVVIQRSRIEENRAASTIPSSHWGGGLYLNGGSFAIHESTIANNTVGQTSSFSSSGGGLFVENALLLLRNSSLGGNRALVAGSQGAELSSSNSTIGFEFVSVRAREHGTPEAIDLNVISSLDLLASVIEASCAPGGTYSSDGFNLERRSTGALASSCGLTNPSDQHSFDPLLRPVAGNGGPTPSHRPLPGTTAFTFGVPSTECATTDQRGALRPGLFCHAGAYEDGSLAPGPWVFADGFESGDVLAWSEVAP